MLSSLKNTFKQIFIIISLIFCINTSCVSTAYSESLAEALSKIGSLGDEVSDLANSISHINNIISSLTDTASGIFDIIQNIWGVIQQIPDDVKNLFKYLTDFKSLFFVFPKVLFMSFYYPFVKLKLTLLQDFFKDAPEVLGAFVEFQRNTLAGQAAGLVLGSFSDQINQMVNNPQGSSSNANRLLANRNSQYSDGKTTYDGTSVSSVMGSKSISSPAQQGAASHFAGLASGSAVAQPKISEVHLQDPTGLVSQLFAIQQTLSALRSIPNFSLAFSIAQRTVVGVSEDAVSMFESVEKLVTNPTNLDNWIKFLTNPLRLISTLFQIIAAIPKLLFQQLQMMEHMVMNLAGIAMLMHVLVDILVMPNLLIKYLGKIPH